MPPSSQADYRRRTVCHDLTLGRCSRRPCVFSHHLVDPLMLLDFVNETDDATALQSGSDEIVYLTLHFTCIRGDVNSGKWRVKVHGGITIRRSSNCTIQPYNPIQSESTFLPGALWDLEKKIYHFANLGTGPVRHAFPQYTYASTNTHDIALGPS